MTPADIDALISRIQYRAANMATKGNADVLREAAAALRELRDENAKLQELLGGGIHTEIKARRALLKAEAERDALQKIVDIANPPDGKADMVALVSQVASKEIIEMALHVVRAERDALKVENARLLRTPKAAERDRDWNLECCGEEDAKLSAITGERDALLKSGDQTRTALRELRDELDAYRYNDNVPHMVAELAQLKAENAALRVDAERYRWLRDNIAVSGDSWEISSWDGLMRLWCIRANLDARIDAARKEKA